MAIDYASIAAKKKKAITDYLANPDINGNFSPAQDVLNRPDDTQSYKDILANYSSAYNLTPDKINAYTSSYLNPTLRAGKIKNQSAVNQAKFNAQRNVDANKFSFPTDQWNTSQQDLIAANQRANQTKSDLMQQQFESEQNASKRNVAQQKADIAAQYGNAQINLGNQYQNNAYQDALQQAMLRSLLGLGGVVGTGYALGAFNKPAQPAQPVQQMAGVNNNSSIYSDVYTDPNSRMNLGQTAGVQ